MKKLLLFSVLAVLCGCETPQYESNTSNVDAYQDSQLRAIFDKRDALRQRTDKASGVLNQLAAEENDLVKKLNDSQLAAYQYAVLAFESHDRASEEIASRNLQKVCDVNTCSTITTLLLRKADAKREVEEIKKEYNDWVRDSEARKQQADLEYRLMMRDSMQSIRR
jgi:alpha-L-arabinofuranosidase